MVKYFVTPKGFFEEYSDDLFSGHLKADLPLPYDKAYDSMELVDYDIEEKVELKFVRMPLSVFQQALAFMKWCHEERKSEGMVCHRYVDGVWSNQVFPQWNTSTSVCYHTELDLAHATRIVGDTHSHPPSYGSQHSHTDGLDERKNNGIFIVVKGFSPMDCSPEIVGCVRGKRFHLKPEAFLDISSYDQNPTFPEEWKGLVGSTPCKGCERRREVERLGKEVSDKRLAYEEDKKFRLVPKAALEMWRKEIAKGKETLGTKVAEALKAIKAKGTQSYPKWFRCDNYGCYKLISNSECPECRKHIGSDKMLDSLVDFLDELDAVTSNPQEVAFIKEIIESEFDPKPLPPVQLGVPAVQPPAPTSTTSSVTEIPKEIPKGSGLKHILVIATEKPCTTDCVYKEVPHEHVASKEKLEEIYKNIIGGKPRENCTAVGKKCVYPEAKACENGCVWSRSGTVDPVHIAERDVHEAARKANPVDPHLPKCSSDGCKASGHSWYHCDIKKVLDTAARMCPSKDCEKSGHTWHACEVRTLMIKLVAAGRMKTTPVTTPAPATTPSAKDDETKRFEACTIKLCQDSDHKNPGNYDCPVAKQRKAAQAEGSPAPYSYPDTTIIGDTAVCPGEPCSHHGSPHKHEIGNTTSEAPCAAEEHIVPEHDIPSC